MPKRIAIFASGSGSNFQNVTEWFKEKSTANVVLLASNKPNSKSIQRALDLGVFSYVFNKESLTRPSGVLAKLMAEKIDFIVLAGFLLKYPNSSLRLSKQDYQYSPRSLPKFEEKECMVNTFIKRLLNHKKQKVA